MTVGAWPDFSGLEFVLLHSGIFSINISPDIFLKKDSEQLSCDELNEDPSNEISKTAFYLFILVGPLQHSCKALSHRVCCYRVLLELENLVKLPYLDLFTHPTWHCCISSWYLYLNIPQTVTQGGQANGQEWSLEKKKEARLQFHSKILVQDENLSIQAEGTPNVGCLFKGSPTGVCVKSEYNCGLSEVASMLLHQVASQLIYWLHEEALAVGMKV